jgi:hypothetical protein
MGLLTETNEAYYGGSNVGNYQYVSFKDLVNNFIIQYVGDNKIISKIRRTDVIFHTKRAIQELNYDTLKSSHSLEIEVPPTLVMQLPQSYVNYSKVFWVDAGGIERIIYPTGKSSNPRAIIQDNDFNYTYDGAGDLVYASESTSWTRFKTASTIEGESKIASETEQIGANLAGGRYGMDPATAQSNGSFYIDEISGTIHFSSNIVGKLIVLKYISDGLANDEDSLVHKFAEEAVYKYIIYAVVSTMDKTPEYVIARYKKERNATRRVAKLRIQNFKQEELTQLMRGKSKHIKN